MLEIAFGKQEMELGGDNSKVKRKPEIERWAMDIYRLACKERGEQNVVSFVCHLDELNPHIHAAILPVDHRNRLHFKNVFAGENRFDFKDNTTALHDRLPRLPSLILLTINPSETRLSPPTPSRMAFTTA